MVKIYTRFQTKMAQKPYPLGRHIAYIGEYPLSPLGPEVRKEKGYSHILLQESLGRLKITETHTYPNYCKPLRNVKKI